MKLVCIGDSITAAQHLDDGAPGWTDLITGFEVYRSGVPGDTTRLGLERFPRDVQVRSPDAVVIQFGHNDANRWETDRALPRVSPSAFAANLAEMVQRVRTFGAEPFVCTITPSARSERHAADTFLYNTILRGATDARLIDVRAAFDSDGFLMPDGIHLTAEGHVRYAETVQRALDAWR